MRKPHGRQTAPASQKRTVPPHIQRRRWSRANTRTVVREFTGGRA